MSLWRFVLQAFMLAAMNCSTLWTAYVDGSAKPNPGRMRIGVVLSAPDGRVYEYSESIGHSGCNNEAEALAAIYALRWLQAKRANQITLITDSSILREQLHLDRPKPITRLADVYTQARALFQQFEHATVQWVPRHRNQQADALARGEMAL